MIKGLINKAFETNSLTETEISQILSSDAENEFLFKKADELKNQQFSNKVFVRAIIEFSSYCRCNCAYCGLNKQNRELQRYRMSESEIVENCIKIYNAGYKTVVLQSGEDLFFTKDKLCNIIKLVKDKTNLVITLSIGERDKEEFEAFYNAGAERFLLKHEIYDEKIYNSMHPHSTFETRIKCLKNLKQIGFETGSGFIVGLKNQTDEILARDILFLKELKADMAGIGIFISHDKTALKGEKDGDVIKTLKVVALTRLLLPSVHLPSTTALNIKSGSYNALFCGADVIMQKATPKEVRDLYEIYPGRESVYVELSKQRNDLRIQLEKLGLEID